MRLHPQYKKRDECTWRVSMPEKGAFLNATWVIVDQDADLAVLHLPSVGGLTGHSVSYNRQEPDNQASGKYSTIFIEDRCWMVTTRGVSRAQKGEIFNY